jgi:hypothetical protein
MDGVEGVHELYSLDPSEFTAARDTLVRSLRAAGDREGAASVAALRKPPRSAWGLNQVARVQPQVVARVHRAATAVQVALDSGDGAALRTAQAEHLAAVEAAVDAAAARGVDGDAMRTRMRNTVLAAGADPEVAEQWSRGELAVDHDAPGFVLAAGASAGRPRTDPVSHASEHGSSATGSRRLRRVGGRGRRDARTPDAATDDPAAGDQAGLDDAAAAAEAERAAQLQRARLRARRELDRRIERLQATVDRTAAAAEEQERRAQEARRVADEAAADLESARQERARTVTELS